MHDMPTAHLQQRYQQAVELIAQAGSLLITAGAGMGVDSGLPDFRGDQGFWNAYPALGEKNLSFTDIANPANFEHDPWLAWGFYGHRLALYRETRPHMGFHLLMELALKLNKDYFVFTSNVDGQFQRAGFDEERIVEAHGSIHHLQCIKGCEEDVWSAEDLSINIDERACQWIGELPVCPHCGDMARPNILMFYDSHWLSRRTGAQKQRLKRWLQTANRPVVIEIGAGEAIPTVRHFGEALSAPLIRLNPQSRQDSAATVVLPATALRGITHLFQECMASCKAKEKIL